MCRLSLAFILAALALAGCRTEPAQRADTALAKPERREKVIPGIPWTADFGKALRLAKTGDKLVMIDFYTDWCEFCKKMEMESFIDKEIVELAKKTIPVRINAEQQRQISARYGVDRFPMILFVDKNGVVVGRIDGYVKPAEFAEQMSLVVGSVG